MLVALEITPLEESGVIQVGADGIFYDFVNVRCYIPGDPPADLVTRWMYGTSVFDNSSTSDRHSVKFFPEPGVLDLQIDNLGYADNGTYVCQAKNASASMWSFASVELVLRG